MPEKDLPKLQVGEVRAEKLTTNPQFVSLGQTLRWWRELYPMYCYLGIADMPSIRFGYADIAEKLGDKSSTFTSDPYPLHSSSYGQVETGLFIPEDPDKFLARVIEVFSLMPERDKTMLTHVMNFEVKAREFRKRGHSKEVSYEKAWSATREDNGNEYLQEIIDYSLGLQARVEAAQQDTREDIQPIQPNAKLFSWEAFGIVDKPNDWDMYWNHLLKKTRNDLGLNQAAFVDLLAGITGYDTQGAPLYDPQIAKSQTITIALGAYSNWETLVTHLPENPQLLANVMNRILGNFPNFQERWDLFLKVFVYNNMRDGIQNDARKLGKQLALESLEANGINIGTLTAEYTSFIGE